MSDIKVSQKVKDKNHLEWGVGNVFARTYNDNYFVNFKNKKPEDYETYSPDQLVNLEVVSDV